MIEFLKQMNAILPYKPGMVFAYLDYDAQVDLNRLVTTPNLNDGEQRVLDSYNNVRQYVSFLHITPEIGIWDWLVNNEHAFLNQWRIKTNNALFQLNSSINNIDSIHNHARTSDSCKKCLNDLLVQLVSVPDYPEEVCRMTIVEIYYEQAVFNNQMWAGMNHNLYSQLNS